MTHRLDFFRDEIRNGFYIPTAVKQSWATALDVLFEIDRICKKHDITYFADWGTFLGAVRHGGIIPWDDDIDIAMLRDDYNKFRAVADSELPEGFAIHDYERKENHWLFLAKVLGNSHICFDINYLNSHYNFPWIASIDIFVKDYLYKDPVEEKKRCDEIMLILAVADGIMDGVLRESTIIEKLRYLEEKYSVKLPPISDKRELTVSLYRLAEQQMERCPKEESDRIGQIFPWVLKGASGEPRIRYESFVRIPFEDTTIPVPAYYNAVLSSRYNNYNIIHKKWDGHEYPAFDKQRQLFEESCGIKMPCFSYDPSEAKRHTPDKSNSLKALASECLLEFYNSLDKSTAYLAAGNLPEIETIFNSMQQLALDLGTMIENVKGENSPRAKRIVKCLEDLCEVIFSCYNSISTDDPECLDPVKRQISILESALQDDLLSVKEILFLPVCPAEWGGFESTYNKHLSDPQCDITILPLPLLAKNYAGQIITSEDDIATASRSEEYPDHLNISSWTDYDLSLHCPETIYIQNTYDNENPYLTVPPYYYASNLRKYTEDLVYIPIGKTAEYSESDISDQVCLGFYLTMPGVVYADRILVQSDNIKTQYVNKLTSWAGQDSLTYWKQKTSVIEDLYGSSETDNTLDSSKKELLFCINFYEFIEHKDVFHEALESRLNLIAKNKDTLHVSVCLYPDFLIEDHDTPEYYRQFRVLTMELSENAGIDVISFPKEDLEGFCSNFTAYYGSSSPIVPVFITEGKPVMLSDYEIPI